MIFNKSKREHGSKRLECKGQFEGSVIFTEQVQMLYKTEKYLIR
jgi:hypothetical protein